MKTEPRAVRESLWPFVLVLAGCGAGILAYTFGVAGEARTLVLHEDAARAQLLRIGSAEAHHHERTGRFGNLPELVEAGDLTDFALVRDGNGVSMHEQEGYRFDVLLPLRRSTEGHVAIGPGEGEDVSPQMRGLHFAAVARPTRPGATGFRTLYIDEAGDVWVSEGVSDEASRRTNPLPRVHLSDGSPRSPLGLNWLRWKEVEARWRTP